MKKKRFYEILEEVNRLQSEMIDILFEEKYLNKPISGWSDSEVTLYDTSPLSTVDIRIQ